MYDISSKKEFIDFLIGEINHIDVTADYADYFNDWMFDVDYPQVTSFSEQDEVFYKVNYDVVSSVQYTSEGQLKLKAGTLSIRLQKSIFAHFHYILIMAYSIGKHKVFYKLIHDKLNKNIDIDRHSFDIADNKLEIE